MIETALARGFLTAAQVEAARRMLEAQRSAGRPADLLPLVAPFLTPPQRETLRLVYLQAADLSGPSPAGAPSTAGGPGETVSDGGSVQLRAPGAVVAGARSFAVSASYGPAAADAAATVVSGLSGPPPASLDDVTVAVDSAAMGRRSQAAASGSRAPGAGKRIGDFEVIGELGRGGMGVVYTARSISLDRKVALKVLLSGEDAGEQEVARFRLEARAAARLKHPNIVGVLQHGQDDEGRWFIAMDLVEGESLQRRLERDGPLPPREAAALARTVAEALDYAHAQSVLHRDLKPHNILLDAEGTPYLTDFGLAKLVGDAQRSLTTTGAGPMGTPAYMPPEQAGGERGRIDARADVYSLGATLYAMLTGVPPFAGDSLASIVMQVVSKPVRSPRALRPELDAALETIVLKCLEKEPEDRYRSAAELARDLSRYVKDLGIVAQRPSPTLRARRWIERNPGAAAGAAAVVLVVLSSIGLVLHQRSQTQAALEQARRRERDAQAAAREAEKAARRAAEEAARRATEEDARPQEPPGAEPRFEPPPEPPAREGVEPGHHPPPGARREPPPHPEPPDRRPRRGDGFGPPGPGPRGAHRPRGEEEWGPDHPGEGGPRGRPRFGPDGRPRFGPDGRPRFGPDGEPRRGPDGDPRRPPEGPRSEGEGRPEREEPRAEEVPPPERAEPRAEEEPATARGQPPAEAPAADEGARAAAGEPEEGAEAATTPAPLRCPPLWAKLRADARTHPDEWHFAWSWELACEEARARNVPLVMIRLGKSKKLPDELNDDRLRRELNDRAVVLLAQDGDHDEAPTQIAGMDGRLGPACSRYPTITCDVHEEVRDVAEELEEADPDALLDDNNELFLLDETGKVLVRTRDPDKKNRGPDPAKREIYRRVPDILAALEAVQGRMGARRGRDHLDPALLLWHIHQRLLEASYDEVQDCVRKLGRLSRGVRGDWPEAELDHAFTRAVEELRRDPDSRRSGLSWLRRTFKADRYRERLAAVDRELGGS